MANIFNIGISGLTSFQARLAFSALNGRMGRRATRSASAARRSVTRPLPSSPHCVPIMRVIGI